MGTACSRRAPVELLSDGEIENHHSQVGQPWPSPNNAFASRPVLHQYAMPLRTMEAMEKGLQEPGSLALTSQKGATFSPEIDDISFETTSSFDGANSDEKDDRNREEKKRLSRMLSDKAISVRLKTTHVAKKGAFRVGEVLRGAGTASLGKAVEALDTLGSTMTNLNPGRGFASGVAPKGNKIGILAFEVANTIVKGCNLRQSLGEEEMRVLKEETLLSEGVQLLVSTNLEELKRIAAADKRDELKIFAGEVVRFGNHCRDPQWHHLDRIFNKLGVEMEIPRQTKEEADILMENLMLLAQNTAELYHELHALDRFYTDLKRKQLEEELFTGAAARGALPPAPLVQQQLMLQNKKPGDSVAFLKNEVKSQEKHVKALKKRSLWAKILEEVMEQLVDIVYFLYQEIHDALATVVSRPNSVPPNTRDTLYQGLPPTLKASLRNRLQQNSRKDEQSVAEIRGDLDKILDWLVPVAANTTKAHHGFGWVGEWANTGSSGDRRSSGHSDLTLLQTLHHANQESVESYILELIVGLHHLVSRARSCNSHRSPQKSPIRSRPFAKFTLPAPNLSPPSPPANGGPRSAGASSPELSQEDKDMLRDIECPKPRKLFPGQSKSQEFDSSRVAQNREMLRLSKSNSHSPSTTTRSETPSPLYKLARPHSLSPLELDIDRIKELDVIDRVDSLRCSPRNSS